MHVEMRNAGRSKFEKEFSIQAFESKLQGILEHPLFK